MPNTRISDLTAATSVAGTDVYPSVQTAGVGPVKTSLTDITAFALANAPAGAVATPSIAPTGDTNTGFWFPAADTIAASTSGQERLRITSAGLVGIGTASPVCALNVVGKIKGVVANAGLELGDTTSSASSYAAMSNNTASLILGVDNSTGSVLTGAAYASFVWSGAAYPLIFATNGSEKMRITSAGNVGIGTTSPSAPLDINVATGYIRVNSTTNTNPAYIYLLNNGGNFFVGRENSGGTAFGTTAYSSVLYSAGAYPMVFFTDSTERMRITSAGNVGIGVSPSAWASSVTALQLPTGAFYSFKSGSVSNFYMMANAYLNSGGSSAYKSTAAATQYVQTGGSHVWSYAASGTADAAITWSEAMRTDSSGNVLIGRTAAYKSATIGSWSFSAATGNGGEGGVEFVNTSTDANSDSNPPIIILKGSTTTSSSARFIQFYANGTTQPMGGIVGNGATNVQFVSLSDARDKENIAPISGSLSKIKSLVPVSFDWKLSGEHVNAGFTAQDVERVFPEFVVENYGDANGEARKGLTGGMTGGIIPHLVKAIQELAAEIAALKAKNA